MLAKKKKSFPVSRKVLGRNQNFHAAILPVPSTSASSRHLFLLGFWIEISHSNEDKQS
jgi:hypothetical protein